MSRESDAYGGRDSRQVDTFGRRSAQASVRIDSSEKAIYGALTAKARCTKDACFVIPDIAEIGLDRRSALRLKCTTGAAVRLTFRGCSES